MPIHSLPIWQIYKHNCLLGLDLCPAMHNARALVSSTQLTIWYEHEFDVWHRSGTLRDGLAKFGRELGS